LFEQVSLRKHQRPAAAKNGAHTHTHKKQLASDPVYLAAGGGHTQALALLLRAGAPFKMERLLKFAAWGATDSKHEKELEALIMRFDSIPVHEEELDATEDGEVGEVVQEVREL
jgi:hypothetical protein